VFNPFELDLNIEPGLFAPLILDTTFSLNILIYLGELW